VRGFTLLEVMVALAIMAGVVLTVLGSVNYHLGVIAAERDSTALTILGRYKLDEIVQGTVSVPDKSEGTFAPLHPEISWRTEKVDTQLPMLKKLVMKVRRTSDKREVTLVRFVL